MWGSGNFWCKFLELCTFDGFGVQNSKAQVKPLPTSPRDGLPTGSGTGSRDLESYF